MGELRVTPCESLSVRVAFVEKELGLTIAIAVFVSAVDSTNNEKEFRLELAGAPTSLTYVPLPS